MKRIVALLAFFAFVGILNVPAVNIVEKSTAVMLDQSSDNQLNQINAQDKDQDKDKKKNKKKKAKKVVVKTKTSESCGSCGESSSCEHATKKSEKGSCCDEKGTCDVEKKGSCTKGNKGK